MTTSPIAHQFPWRFRPIAKRAGSMHDATSQANNGCSLQFSPTTSAVAFLAAVTAKIPGLKRGDNQHQKSGETNLSSPANSSPNRRLNKVLKKLYVNTKSLAPKIFGIQFNQRPHRDRPRSKVTTPDRSKKKDVGSDTSLAPPTLTIKSAEPTVVRSEGVFPPRISKCPG